MRMGAAAELVIDEHAGGPEAVVEEHRRMAYRIAYSVLRNHHDAEDAMQEAFLRIWRASAKLPQIADRKAWVARIAWNVANDQWHRLSVCAAGIQANVSELAGAVARLHDRGANVEEIAAGAELQRLLEALIAGLPPKLRDVLVLSTVEELEAAEIGRVLGVSSVTVRVRLFQARRLLRAKMERLLVHHRETKAPRGTK